MTINKKLQAVLDEILNSTEVIEASGSPEKKFTAITLTYFSHMDSTTSLNIGVWPDGNVEEYIYGKSVEEVFEKLKAYNPEEAKRLKIAELKSKLAELEAA